MKFGYLFLLLLLLVLKLVSGQNVSIDGRHCLTADSIGQCRRARDCLFALAQEKQGISNVSYCGSGTKNLETSICCTDTDYGRSRVRDGDINSDGHSLNFHLCALRYRKYVKASSNYDCAPIEGHELYSSPEQFRCPLTFFGGSSGIDVNLGEFAFMVCKLQLKIHCAKKNIL